jgi:hypothetical protein
MTTTPLVARVLALFRSLGLRFYGVERTRSKVVPLRSCEIFSVNEFLAFLVTCVSIAIDLGKTYPAVDLG